MNTYTPQHNITRWDVEHLAFGINRYLLTIEDVRELLGDGQPVARQTAYVHVRRWIDAGFAYRKGEYILFPRKTYYRCSVPFPYTELAQKLFNHYRDTNMVERRLKTREDMKVVSWVGERLLRHERGLSQTMEYRPHQICIPDAVARIYFPDTQET